MEELKHIPPAEIPADSAGAPEEEAYRPVSAPERHIDLHDVRRLRMEAKKQEVVQARCAGEDFWALRFPTWDGLKKAARNVLCAPFNLVAAPVESLRRHMWRQSFFEAVRQRDIRVAAEALDAGVDIAAEKERAFLTAIYNNDVEMARLLYTHGADVNFRNGLPLVLSVMKGHAKMTACLLHELKASRKTHVYVKIDASDPPGAEISALVAVCWPVPGPLHRVLKKARLLPAANPGFVHVMHAGEGICSRMAELQLGKLAYSDGEVVYLDPAKKDRADASRGPWGFIVDGRRVIPTSGIYPWRGWPMKNRYPQLKI